MMRNTTLKLWRDRTGLACTNVPRLAVQSSPTGYEWGYGGSGPSDLALNILEYALRRMGYKGQRYTCWGGQRIFQEADRLRSQYKCEVIAKLTIEGGEIPLFDVIEWIKAHQK